MKKYSLFIFCSIILAGCSERALYENGQRYQKKQCLKEAVVHEQRDECRNTQSYDAYKEERKIIIK